MKKFFVFGVTALVFMACSTETKSVEAKEESEVAVAEETAMIYDIDHSVSTIEWMGEKHLGKTHHGGIQLVEGNFAVEEGGIAAGNFVADMQSISNFDLPEDGEYNQAMLVGHLMSADFFDAENHPTSSFEITSISEGADENGNTHIISGNFTIRGVTKEISFPAKISISEDDVNLVANFHFNRLDWGASYDEEGVKGFIDGIIKKGKDDFVKDEVGLNINLVAKRV